MGYVREFMTTYTTLDPFHANDYADRILAQGTGDFAKMFKEKENEILIQVASAEPTTGTVRRGGRAAVERQRQRRRAGRDEDLHKVAGRQVDDRERKPLGCNGHQGRTAVEDQPADSGDLTTDAELPAQPADAAAADDATGATAARRRHRMPLRKELASTSEAGDDTATDETTESDEQPDPTSPKPPKPKPRHRVDGGACFVGARKRLSLPLFPHPQPEAAEAEEPDAPKPAGRTPVGKASRAAKTVTEPEPTVDEEPVATPRRRCGSEAEDAPQEEQILVPHRPAGKRLIIAAAAAGVVFVGAAAFAGATLQPYLSDRALVHTKLDIARTAANAITTLWTYTPDNMDSLAGPVRRLPGRRLRQRVPQVHRLRSSRPTSRRRSPTPPR